MNNNQWMIACPTCNGSGKITHNHSTYCWKEGWGLTDTLDCSSCEDECKVCQGKGSKIRECYLEIVGNQVFLVVEDLDKFELKEA